MKWLTTYWLIGCVISGYVIGWYSEKCPHDELPTMQEVAFSVAVWPAPIVSAIFYDAPPLICKVRP